MRTGGSKKIPDYIWAAIEMQILFAISQRPRPAEDVATAIQSTVSRHGITNHMLVRRAWKVVSRIPDVHFHIPKKQKSRKGASHKHSSALDALDISALCEHVREDIPEADDELITAIIHRLLD